MAHTPAAFTDGRGRWARPASPAARHLDPGRDPWERQPGESSVASVAFVAYRDAGPTRSLTQAARALDKNRTTLGEWSRQWRWVERTELWEREQDRVRREAQVDAVRRMAERHAEIALAMITKAILRLVGGVDPRTGREVEAIDPSTLTAYEAIRLVDVGVRIERLARGEPTVAVAHAGEVSAFDSDLARAIIEDPVASSLACDILDRLVCVPREDPTYVGPPGNRGK